MITTSGNAQFCNSSDKSNNICSREQKCPDISTCNIPAEKAVTSISGTYIPKTTGSTNEEIKRLIRMLNKTIQLRFQTQNESSILFEIIYKEKKKSITIYQRSLNRRAAVKDEYFADQISLDPTGYELINSFLKNQDLENTKAVVKSTFDQLSIKFRKVN
ncbi:hypothetical protein [Terrimonas sp.]|uniref:hypothetical protein n=1 Tax=Terrimonas sp. TaxID=1914338 RepID=UPI001056E267|nr:hypothetical protein [Terrimonas sp.]